MLVCFCDFLVRHWAIQLEGYGAKTKNASQFRFFICGILNGDSSTNYNSISFRECCLLTPPWGSAPWTPQGAMPPWIPSGVLFPNFPWTPCLLCLLKIILAPLLVWSWQECATGNLKVGPYTNFPRKTFSDPSQSFPNQSAQFLSQILTKATHFFFKFSYI